MESRKMLKRVAPLAVVVILSASALAQRSSPQFNLPAPGSVASPFGSDVFAGNQGGVDQSPAVGQLIAQSNSQSGASSGQSAAGSGVAPAQPRPSLTLGSLPVAASSPARPQAQQAQPLGLANGRQALPAASSSVASARPKPRPSGANNPAGLQTQITSQAREAGGQQAAIDAARKLEANSASQAATSGAQNYRCPDLFGYFRHHKSCDKYYACDNGTATLKICGNGLMFDDSDPKRENCAYPFSVDCGDRSESEPPISTQHCPRLYGLFADTGNCRVFYSCWNGEASKYECPPGLAYDNEQRVCVWADLVDRCDQSEVSDGFVCPDASETDQPGHYTRHAHPTDCRKFYVCIEGVARPYGCSLGTVFNVDSLQCDEPDNVTGCEKYYGDLDPKLAKKLARENVAQSNPQATPTSGRSRSSQAASASAASTGQAKSAA